MALDFKVRGDEPDSVTNDRCRVLADHMLPEGNLHPRSMYLLEKAMGCRRCGAGVPAPLHLIALNVACLHRHV